MNKVITVNLNGNAYPLEENGYEQLRAYLDEASRTLAGNPDRDEIVADIERAIAEKFRATLGPHRTVVTTAEVVRVIAEMGPVDAGVDASEATAGAAAPEASVPPHATRTTKQLFKIRDGAMIAGVCNGVAAYFGINAIIVRVIVTLLAFPFGVGIPIYLLLAILLPTASTPEDMAAAEGFPQTAREFIHRARAGYYDGMRTFSDKRAHRAWKRRFRQEMRHWKRDFHREVHGYTGQWQQNWHRYWSDHAQPAGGSWLALPILAVFTSVVVVSGIAAIGSLVLSHALFGVALPAGIPLWFGVVLVIIACQLVLWPLRALRRAALGAGFYGRHPANPVLWLWDGLLSVLMLGLLIWLVDRHVPAVQRALADLPEFLRAEAVALRDWWQHR